jgi:acetylornithine deacetylase/succinyl-diaminopimelate desuccinylase-like protein
LGGSLGSSTATGIVTVEPGSVNTIPGRVKFSLDIRAPTDSILDGLEKHLRCDFDDAIFEANATRTERMAAKLSVTWHKESDSPAINFDDKCISAVGESAADILGDSGLARDMISSAGHDSVSTSRRCPTSMILVPSRDGISHNPKEYASPEHCAIGADVLMQSVLRFDSRRTA